MSDAERSLLQRGFAWFHAHATVKNIATLLTGTALAQVVSLALSIPLARLYAPTEYGVLALYQAIVSFLATIAAFRFDVTVILPEGAAEARTVKSLATICILITSFIATGAAIIVAPWVGTIFSSPILTWWLPTIGVAVFLMAETTNLQYWLNRSNEYRAIAKNRLTGTVATLLCQLVLTLLTRTAAGLILGTLLGLAIAYGAAVWRTRDLLAKPDGDSPTLRQMAHRYRRMPLVNGPNALVDSIRVSGISFLVARVAMSALGQFNLAWRVVQAPVGMLISAVGQVFLRKLSSTPRGSVYPTVKRSLRGLILVALPVMTIFGVVAPWLIPFVFGSAWTQAGLISQALTPWLFVNILSSPLASIYVVTEAQGRLLFFAIVYCAAPLTLLWLTPWSLVPTIWALSGIMAILLIIMIVMSVVTARAYDAAKPSASG